MKKILAIIVIVFIIINVILQAGLLYVNATFDISTLYTMRWPSNDKIKSDHPNQYFVQGHSYFELQGYNQCAGYSSAYFMRANGIDIDGEAAYANMNLSFLNGYIMPQSVLDTFQDYGLDVRLYRGDLDSLKTRVAQGMPVVTLIGQSIYWQHYINVVGFDQDNIYLYDSLNAGDNGGYNRIMSNADFEAYWDNAIPFFSNVYFVLE